MLKGHAFFGIVAAETPDHFTVIGITRYDGRFAGFCLRKCFFPEQETESTFCPDAAVAGDTFSVDDRFDLRIEIHLVRMEQTGIDDKRCHDDTTSPE